MTFSEGTVFVALACTKSQSKTFCVSDEEEWVAKKKEFVLNKADQISVIEMSTISFPLNFGFLVGARPGKPNQSQFAKVGSFLNSGCFA